MGRFTHASLAAAGFIGQAGLGAPRIRRPDVLLSHNVATNPPLGNSVDSNVTLQGTVDGTSVGPEPEFAVEVVLTVNPGTSANPSTEYTLPTWCVDIFHDIFVPSSGETYSVGSLTTYSSLNPTALTSTQIQEIGDLVNYGDNLMQTSPERPGRGGSSIGDLDRRVQWRHQRHQPTDRQLDLERVLNT